jgi:6-phosphogluconolactonase
MPQFSIFYVTACAAGPDGGIYKIAINRQNGALQIAGFTRASWVNYLVFSRDKTSAYCTMRNYPPGSEAGGVAAFAVGPERDLIFRRALSAGGLASCHLAIDPLRGKYLYCANYLGASVAEFRLTRGVPEQRCKLIKHYGHGPHPRQNVSHPHCVSFTLDGQYLCVTDLGADCIKVYPFDQDSGVTAAGGFTCRLPAGSGPRHLVFDPAGHQAYLASELVSSLTVLRYERGRLIPEATLSTLPAGFAGVNTCAAVRLSLDGQYILVSNRGHNSIACFQTQKNGVVARYDLVAVNGKSPRDINFVADGRFVVAANEQSNEIRAFSFDRTSGKLSACAGRLALPRPVCVAAGV